jgi:hypothetical protein
MAVSAVGLQPTSENYISTIGFINKRNVDENLFDKYPGNGMVKLLDLMGRSRPLAGVRKEWVEKDRIFQAITAAANVTAPGAGANLVVTLSAASHRDSGTQSYPRTNQLVLLKNGKVGQVITKNVATAGAHVITIKPLKAADDLGAVTAGDSIIFFSNAWSEGSGQGTGLTPIPLNYAMQLQTIKETYSETSTSGLTRTWFRTVNSEGQESYRWGFVGEADTFKRFNAAVALALLVGEQSDAGYTGPDGLPTMTTQGIIPSIRNGGNNFVASSFALTSWDTIIKTLNKQKGAKENIMPMGIDLSTTIDGQITAAMKSDQINYEFLSKASDTNKVDAGRQRAAMFGFDSFKKSNFSFHMWVTDDFNEEYMLGATGYTYANKALILPADKKAIIVDGKTINQDCLSIIYQEMDGMSREYEHWTTGGGTMSSNKTDEFDVTKLHYRCTKGAQVVCANRFGIIE